MTQQFDLVLRQVTLHGASQDVGIADGCIAAFAPKLPRSDNDVDGQGNLLIPGLHDHHMHIFATAARAESVDLAGIIDSSAVAAVLQSKGAQTQAGSWIRAVGYDERASGLPDRQMLDQWVPTHPLRLQDRTGALWILNSAALSHLGEGPWPGAVETDANGLPTGRIWRGDSWLRERIGSKLPSLAGISKQLASWGVTAVTDASVHNGREESSRFTYARQSGEWLQKLTLMGREDLPAGEGYALGPVKLLFDERDLPDIASIASHILAARIIGRSVAAHCVTDAELVTYLAALEGAGGAKPGDRIEHGSFIPNSLIPDIAKAQLTVVINPAFIARRGDRYLTEIEPFEQANLHRATSLLESGVTVLAGSDAPYGPLNPWVAIRAAIDRHTPSGAIIGAAERCSADQALAFFDGSKKLAVGSAADCCLVDPHWAEELFNQSEPNPVRLTLCEGRTISPWR